MATKKIKAVAAICYDDQERYLVGKRNADRIAASKWEFPGGKVEKSESLVAALKREIFEELGDSLEKIEQLNPTITHDYPWGFVEITFFKARLKSQNLNKVAESEFRWGSVPELLALDLLPASREILEVLYAK